MHDNEKNEPSDSSGVMGRMSRLKHHGGATATELRAFLQKMKGKNPQEVLGLIAQSDLIRSTALAAVLFAALLLVFTILPAMMSGDGAKAVAAADDRQQQNDDANKANAKKQDGKAKVAGKKGDDKGKQPTAVIPDKSAGKDDDILKALDIGDTKNSDPSKNPLDGFDPFKGVKE